MEIHQFATSLTYGDAISDEMLEIQNVLRDNGYKSEIFVRFYDPRLAGLIHDFRDYPRFSSPKNVVLFHFSIGSPVSKMFQRIPDKRIMIYHNITPYEFFLDTHRILARECYKGRLELKQFVKYVDLALGDSEFNAGELREAGYRETGVLPILMDFSKFDKNEDPVIKRIYDNGKWTVLFVGRVIPNKKFEDIIKAFYFYKKHFNSHSQLILAGDFRGMERYLGALKKLVGELELSDVHFTGHVDFSELLAYFKLADVYLSMSEHEGFGVPLLESFYLKIPVIAFDAGAVGETMKGGGILLKKKDFFKTSAVLDKVQKDAKFREKVIEGQTIALKEYDRKNTSRILLKHIKRVSQT